MLNFPLIHIDGMDAQGKSTIILELKKHIKHRYIISGRGPLSQIAYHHLFNRDPSEIETYVELAKSINDYCLSFWIIASKSNTQKYSKGRGEDPENLFVKGTTYEDNYQSFEWSFNLLKTKNHCSNIWPIHNDGNLKDTINQILSIVERSEDDLI